MCCKGKTKGKTTLKRVQENPAAIAATGFILGTPEAAMKQNVPGAHFVIAGPFPNRQAEGEVCLAHNAERKAKETVGKNTNHLFWHARRDSNSCGGILGGGIRTYCCAVPTIHVVATY